METDTKKEMNVLFSCDSNYVMPLAVCLTSLFENNKRKIQVYVFYSKLLAEEIKVLTDLTNKYEQKINFIRIEDSFFSDVPTLRWTRETYYRLLAGDLLPVSAKRLLYLDCDIIINKPINDLYELSLEKNYLATLEEKNNHSSRGRLGLDPIGGYFQAGVILFDLDKCREILNYKKVTRVINELGEKLLIVDQDVINVMFDGKITALDKKFNDCEITNFQNSNLNRLFNQVDKKSLDETCIFHYATGKPWNNLYSGSCEEIWYKYLKLSPYRDLYERKFCKLKYKTLRLGLIKVFFYEYIHLTPYINKLALTLFPKNLYNKLKKFYRKKIK